ncbi:unnamed protein product [Hydatigera taeniaeformis]|uniref:DRBM domain-containing protein n=1 Tax=Hydatigena taeniaeformis TaxID=6205 RepID=A0A0R3XB92_HYDTA|nr:unnamed protein product [Hydatigera taeniaeformis]
MYSPSSQTPIGILQETATKRGFLVHYELVASEGEAHEPIYVYQCRVGKITAFGKGASKKKAKHLAAYYVLLRLIGDDPPSQGDRALLQAMRASLSFLGIDVGDSLAVTCEDEVNAAATRAPVNYVSKVQEYCDKNLWPPPTYEFSECSQNLFGGKYHCKIRLWRWEFSGFGSSKKEAKRKAATEFLKEVVEQGLTIPTDALEAMEEENLPLVEKQDLNKLKVKQSSQEMASRMARKILSGLHTANGRVKEIHVEELNSPDFDVYDVLKRVLEANKLGVFYSYTTNTKSGSIYCQAQLSTIPPHVTCSRPSASIDEARRDAAYRCLVYLDTMTKPNPTLCEEAWFRRPS